MSARELPNPFTAGDAMSEPAADQPAETQVEFLHRGAVELSRSITGFVYESPDPWGKVVDYLGVSLADKECRVVAPAGRAAAFAIMATAQRDFANADLVNVGKTMVDKLAGNNLGTRPALDKSRMYASKAFRSPAALDDAFVLLDLHVNEMQSWCDVQTQIYRSFSNIHDTYGANLREIARAEKTLTPDFSGKPRDNSHTIYPNVRAAVAEKLTAAVTTAQLQGQSPEEEVIDMVDQPPDSDAILMVEKLHKFGQNYTGSLRRKIAKLKAAKAKVDATTNRRDVGPNVHKTLKISQAAFHEAGASIMRWTQSIESDLE